MNSRTRYRRGLIALTAAALAVIAAPSTATAAIQAEVSATGTIHVTGDGDANSINVSLSNATNGEFWPSISVSTNSPMTITGQRCRSGGGGAQICVLDADTPLDDGCVNNAHTQLSCLLNRIEGGEVVGPGDAPFDVVVEGGGGADDINVQVDAGDASSLTRVEVVGGADGDRLTVRRSHDDDVVVQPTITPAGGDDQVDLAHSLGATVDLGAGNDAARLLSRQESESPARKATITGGDGLDTFVDQTRDSNTLTTTGAGDHTLSTVEQIIASHPRTGSLTITGSDDDELLAGTGTQAAFATINGAGGHDVLVDGGSAVLNGGAGNDALVGCTIPVAGIGSFTAGRTTDPAFVRSGVYCQPASSAGSPHNLAGGIGDDLLIGGTGADAFDGGDGSDIASSQGHRGPLIAGTSSFEGVALDFSTTPPTSLNLGTPDTAFTAMEGLEGSVFNDVFVGRTVADDVRGGPTLATPDATGAGFDALRAIIAQGNDADDLDGAGGNDTVRGGRGDDTITGEEGVDTLDGAVGDDTYLLGGGTSTIVEDAQNRRHGGAQQIPEPGIVDPGTGLASPREFHGDTVSYRFAPGPVAVQGELGEGTLYRPEDTTATQPLDPAKKDTWTPAQIEIYQGSPGPDFVAAGPGDQLLEGQEGADAIFGGSGEDQLDDGAGDSFESPLVQRGIDGGEGDDEVLGGAGADLLVTSPGADLVDCGGDDADFADYSLAPAAVRVTVDQPAGDDGVAGEGDTVTGCDTVQGTPGADELTGPPAPERASLIGGAGNDTLRAGTGGGDLLGEGGDDRFVPLKADTPASIQTQVFGGPGDLDHLDLATAPGAVTVREEADGTLGTTDTGGATFDSTAVEEVTGTPNGDELTMLDTSVRGHILHGGGGVDFVDGGGGADNVDGDAGDDRVRGGPGTDGVFGNAGTDDFRLGDGEADTSDCGPGERASTVDAGLDTVDAGCQLGAAPQQQLPPLAPLTPEGEPGLPPLAPLTPVAGLPAQGSGSPSDVDANGRVGSDGSTQVTVSCTAPAGCSGTVELSAPGAAATALGAAAKPTVLGRTTYKLRAGQKKVLKVKLNSKGRKLLKRAKRVRATLRVIPVGGGKAVTRTLTLRALGKRR